ncbi:hypothetical protein PG994_005260 [Apiospora phragmitis]|uniref:Uncharacterized protein n=1 Tax=Apiospora phragmitis TaxID=2905665 RepID=A0ABR1VVL8_9PEZI
MAGKHESATATATATEPSWRPFQKLSGFMRHGSTKNRKVSPSQPVVQVGDDRHSVFRLGRNRSGQKSPSTESTIEFKPLEVDISKLESIRLAEAWLEQEPPPKKPDPEQLKKKPLPKPPPVSSTPIADLFASKAEFDSGLPDRGRRHTHLFLGATDAQTIARKPVPTSPAPTTTTTQTTTTTITTREPPATHSATYSILERGRPIEPKDIIPLEPAADAAVDDAAPAQSSVAQKRRSLQSSQSNAVPPRSSWSSASKPVTGFDTRHSMFASVTPTPTGRIDVGTSRPIQTPRSASTTPLDRIQAWQKSITSAPTAPPPANALGTPQGSAPVRKVSPRGLAGNRLAWIRELEEKKSSDLRKDVGVLKKQAGSVSDKLAMFENKGTSGPTSNPRLPPLSRSNSTTSRMSSVGLKSTTTSSAWDRDNATATPRTSIDTTRSSHHNSGVLSYYDDSFREKMEGLVANLAEKDDEDKTAPVPRKRRITASFVSVEGGKKAAQAMAAAGTAKQEDAVVSDAKPEEDEKKAEEPVVAAQEETVKAEEAPEATPAVEPEQVDAPVVDEAEKASETVEPAQVEEVTPEVPAKVEVEVEAQPEVAAPEVAEEEKEEKVAEELPSQEEPAVPQPEPEVAMEQPEPVEQVAETLAVAGPAEQEKVSELAAAEVPLPESDDEAADEIEETSAKIDI